MHSSKRIRNTHLPLALGPALDEDWTLANEFLHDCETDNVQLYVSAEQAAMTQFLTWGEREGTLVRGGGRTTRRSNPRARRDFRPRRNAR